MNKILSIVGALVFIFSGVTESFATAQTSTSSDNLPVGFTIKRFLQKERSDDMNVICWKNVDKLEELGFNLTKRGTMEMELGSDDPETIELPTLTYSKDGIEVTLVRNFDSEDFYVKEIHFPNRAMMDKFLKTATDFCMAKSEWSDTYYTLRPEFAGLVGMYLEGNTIHFDFNA